MEPRRRSYRRWTRRRRTNNDISVWLKALAPFQARLRTRAESLDIGERQRIVRLLVKEVIVGSESIIIRHCLPIAPAPVAPPAAPACGPSGGNSLLCTEGPRRQGFATPRPTTARP